MEMQANNILFNPQPLERGLFQGAVHWEITEDAVVPLLNLASDQYLSLSEVTQLRSKPTVQYRIWESIMYLAQ